ncbi:glyoxalase [Zafaria cholistanensis]|uniref:Glyoxalase n=1 Tax=Zafaria cholistanensis TaxID=1682741 RepID=A0A5A7NQ16_9MICC|nr:VOC family protein [Zafaria cholistanensis]GER22107.1 glyoxalase [Zafaria cholistanensis]
MADDAEVTLSAVVLGTPEPGALARFYAALLGWELLLEERGWVSIGPPDGGVGLSFQEEAEHVPPTWPAAAGEPQMQLHLDFRVRDLEAASARAARLGARPSGHQPEPGVRVFVDPAGHPFCLFEG